MNACEARGRYEKRGGGGGVLSVLGPIQKRGGGGVLSVLGPIRKAGGGGGGGGAVCFRSDTKSGGGELLAVR